MLAFSHFHEPSMLRDFTALIGLIGIVFAVAVKICFQLRRGAALPLEAADLPETSMRVRSRGHWHQSGRRV